MQLEAEDVPGFCSPSTGQRVLGGPDPPQSRLSAGSALTQLSVVLHPLLLTAVISYSATHELFVQVTQVDHAANVQTEGNSRVLVAPTAWRHLNTRSLMTLHGSLVTILDLEAVRHS
jgi:hypothetical protein